MTGKTHALAPAVTMPSQLPLRSVSDGGRAILDRLLKSGGLTQAEITRSLDLAQPTVARLLQGFVTDGMVATGARKAGGPGHPSALMTLNPDFAYAFGFAILGDRIAADLIDFSGVVRASRWRAMPTMKRAETLDGLNQFKRELVAEAGVDPKRVIGAGIGISGYYIGQQRRINPPAYLDDFALIDLEPVFADGLDLPVIFDNDANVAAMAENLLGVGRRSRDFVYLHFTNGFGGGVIADGKPFLGHWGNAGDFAAIWTPLGMTPPNLDLLRTEIERHGPRFGTLDDMLAVITPQTPGVESWIEMAVEPLSVLCALLTCAIDPEYIVIGGRLPQPIAEQLARRIAIVPGTKRRDFPPPTPSIIAAEGPPDPVSVGAAAMYMRHQFFT